MPLVAQPHLQLVAAARRHEPDAWNHLLQHYQLPLFTYARELLRDREAALDAVQETFRAAVRNIGGLRDDAKFASWLFGIMHQKCLQHLRRKNSWSAWWLAERERDPSGARYRILAAETWVRLARTALALERFRLAHDGALPEKLDELVPAFLPEVLRDPIDGAPLRYRLKQDGEFALYSIGLNGVDDDGALSNWTWTTGYMIGDWSWPMPVKE